MRTPGADLGSIRVSRVGFGAAPKQSLPQYGHFPSPEVSGKVRDGDDAVASTREARAPQT